METLVGDSIRGITHIKIRSVGRDRLDRFGPLRSVIPYVMCFVSLCSMVLMTAEIFDRKEPRRGLDPKALPLQVAPLSYLWPLLGSLERGLTTFGVNTASCGVGGGILQGPDWWGRPVSIWDPHHEGPRDVFVATPGLLPPLGSVGGVREWVVVAGATPPPVAS